MILDVINGPLGDRTWVRFAKRLSRASGVILYHGTSSILLERILNEGLLPREATGISTYEGQDFGGRSLESNPALVYLIHRGMIGFGGNRAVQKHGGHLVAFRVLITDLSALRPDEDSHKKTWYGSIAWEDSCAHEGTIPSANILGWLRRKIDERHGIEYFALREDPPIFQECDGRAHRYSPPVSVTATNLFSQT